MKHKIDWPSFSAAVAIIALVSTPLLLFPESGSKVLAELYGFISNKFGFLYLIAGMAALILLLWLALGRYGKIRLATGDEQPEFGDFRGVTAEKLDHESFTVSVP